MTLLSTVANEGDQLKTLKKLRQDLAGKLELATNDQNYGTLARIFIDTVDKIAALEGKAKGAGGTALDELSKRRAASGRPDSSSAASSSRSAKRG